MLAKYEITTDGSSNGNVIAQPFFIEVHKMTYIDSPHPDPGVKQIDIYSCTLNEKDFACENDDVPNYIGYDVEPDMSTSKNDDLVSTFEQTLESVYPGNWKKI